MNLEFKMTLKSNVLPTTPILRRFYLKGITKNLASSTDEIAVSYNLLTNINNN